MWNDFWYKYSNFLPFFLISFFSAPLHDIPSRHRKFHLEYVCYVIFKPNHLQSSCFALFGILLTVSWANIAKRNFFSSHVKLTVESLDFSTISETFKWKSIKRQSKIETNVIWEIVRRRNFLVSLSKNETRKVNP